MYMRVYLTLPLWLAAAAHYHTYTTNQLILLVRTRQSAVVIPCRHVPTSCPANSMPPPQQPRSSQLA
jgi:hypothetical protein